MIRIMQSVEQGGRRGLQTPRLRLRMRAEPWTSCNQLWQQRPGMIGRHAPGARPGLRLRIGGRTSGALDPLALSAQRAFAGQHIAAFGVDHLVAAFAVGQAGPHGVVPDAFGGSRSAGRANAAQIGAVVAGGDGVLDHGVSPVAGSAVCSAHVRNVVMMDTAGKLYFDLYIVSEVR